MPREAAAAQGKGRERWRAPSHHPAHARVGSGSDYQQAQQQSHGQGLLWQTKPCHTPRGCFSGARICPEHRTELGCPSLTRHA